MSLLTIVRNESPHEHRIMVWNEVTNEIQFIAGTPFKAVIRAYLNEMGLFQVADWSVRELPLKVNPPFIFCGNWSAEVLIDLAPHELPPPRQLFAAWP